MLDIVSFETDRSQSSATSKIGDADGESNDEDSDIPPKVRKRKTADFDDGESEDDRSDGPPQVRKRKITDSDDGESEQEPTEEESSHSDDSEADCHSAKMNVLGNGEFISLSFF